MDPHSLPPSKIWNHLSPDMRWILSTSGSASSIATHNQGLEALGMGRDLAYLSMSRPISAEQYAGLLRSPLVRGGAVTGQGLKSAIIPFLDVVDPQAAALGAVNTVVNQAGLLHGYNTDAHGLEVALRKHLDLSGIRLQKAVIYGNGGVSGVAAHVVRKLKGEATMAGRSPGHVDAKMAELGLRPLDGPFDLLINATPISSAPVDQAMGLLPALEGARMVFDHCMPEKLGKDNLLARHCQERGIHYAPGKDMYVPQMLKQWALFLEGVTEHQIALAWGLTTSS